jgi:hypothetical protein
MSLDVGVLFPTVEGRTYEFWMEMTLQPEPEDGEDSLFYLRVIKAHWMERMRHESPYVAQSLEQVGDDFGVKMKYGFNKIRIWYVPSVSLAAGFKQSIAEEPIPKATELFGPPTVHFHEASRLQSEDHRCGKRDLWNQL